MAQTQYNKDLPSVFTGGMDQDSSDRYIKAGDYRILKNGIVDQDGSSGRFAVKNLKSTSTLVSLSGSLTCLGATVYKDDIYAFYYNSTSGNTELFKIATASGTDVQIFDIDLGNDADTRIKDIDIVENLTNGNLYCYWTDAENEPFGINITSGNYTTKEEMYNAKVVPPEPTITPIYDPSESSVLFRDKAFQFATRWVYENGEKTPLSTYSKSAYYPKITNESLYTSGSIGYYVDDGYVFRVDNFDSESIVSSGYDVDYNNAICNSSGDIVLISSDNTEIPILISVNGGVNFNQCYDEINDGIISAWGIDMCSSSDGQYIFLSTFTASSRKVYSSDNYGSSFSEVYTTGSILYNICCSANGKFVFLNYHNGVLRSDDYGVSFEIKIDSSSATTTSGLGVSPSGKNVVASKTSAIFISNDFGNSFQEKVSSFPYMGFSVTDDNVIFGVGYDTTEWVIKLTTDSFATTTDIQTYTTDQALDPIRTRTLSFKDGGVITIPDATGSTYNFYKSFFFDELGNLINSYSSDAPSSFNSAYNFRLDTDETENLYNKVDVFIEKPNDFVQEVEVYAINTNSNAALLIKTISNDDISISGETIEFKNNAIYRVLSDTERNVLFSNVPIIANNQSFIGNRLFYLNYNDGVDFPSDNFPNFSVEANYDTFSFRGFRYEFVSPYDYSLIFYIGVFPIYKNQYLAFSFLATDENGNSKRYLFQHIFTQDYTSIHDASCISEINTAFGNLISGSTVSIYTTFNSLLFQLPSTFGFQSATNLKIGDETLTYKKGNPVQVGIVYYDDYNRGSFPVFDSSDVYISSDIRDEKVTLRVTINQPVPNWATKYKFVRTDRRLDYTIIRGFQYVKFVSNSVWLLKYDEDVYVPEEGMTLNVFQQDGSNYSFTVEQKEYKEAGFSANSPAGEWIRIKNPSDVGYSGYDILRGTDLYSISYFYAEAAKDLEDDVVFYEIPNEYSISGGYHVGNVQSQTATLPAIVDIEEDGNVFYSDTGEFEFYKITSTSNYYNGGRSLIDTEQTGEINRYASISWSDAFVQDTGYNGLSMFNLGIVNFKNLDIADGAITHSHPIETNLYIWQEDEVGYVLVNKDAITSATGGGVVTSSSSVVGEFVPYAGIHGTEHGESVAIFGNSKYFVDTGRTAICKLGGDGVGEISDYYMTSYFNGILSPNNMYYGVFNPQNKEYWVYDKTNSTLIVFDEKTDRWTRLITPISIDKIINDHKYIYTFEGNVIYTHMNGNNYGSIHGTPVEFELNYIENKESSQPKIYNAVELESNKALDVEVEANELTSSISGDDFEIRENEYFAYIPNSGDVGDLDSDLETGNIIPLGNVVDSVGGDFTLNNNAPNFSTINHDIYYDNLGVATLFGELLSVEGDEVTTDNTTAPDDFLNDKFVFAKEKSYLNARNVRGNTLNVTITDDSDTYTEIYGVNINTTKANN